MIKTIPADQLSQLLPVIPLLIETIVPKLIDTIQVNIKNKHQTDRLLERLNKTVILISNIKYNTLILEKTLLDISKLFAELNDVYHILNINNFINDLFLTVNCLKTIHRLNESFHNLYEDLRFSVSSKVWEYHTLDLERWQTRDESDLNEDKLFLKWFVEYFTQSTSAISNESVKEFVGKIPVHYSLEDDKHTLVFGVFYGEEREDQLVRNGKIKYFNGHIYRGECAGGKPHGQGKYTALDYWTYTGQYVCGLRSGVGEITWRQDNERIMYTGNWENNQPNGHGKETYRNGDEYLGNFKNGIRTGKGEMTYKNGETYKGDWSNGDANGNGQYEWPNGDLYNGGFLNGLKHGSGYYKRADGHIYKGSYKNDFKHGKGKLTLPNGNEYSGDFIRDVAAGEGIYHYYDGSVYSGRFEDGEATGNGRLFSASGDLYSGSFINGEPNGIVQVTFSDGRLYHGNWAAHCPNGFGRFQWPDGDVYEGQFLNSRLHGTGIYFFSTGHRFEGTFDANKRTGNGVFFWSEGHYYAGSFLDGKRHGSGKYHIKDGPICVGQFKNDKVEGHAKLTWPDGNKYDGELDTNFNPHGQGELQFADERVYVGHFVHGIMQGWGKMTHPNGDVYIGEFENNQFQGQGMMVYGDDNIRMYEGEWSHGLYDGVGKLFWGNSVFEGSFLAGNRHGKGVMMTSEGHSYSGTWENEVMKGPGEIKYANGDQYLGQVFHTKRHGHGKMIYKDFTIPYEGDWINDKPRGIIKWRNPFKSFSIIRATTQ
ncbi:hypothetical protein HDV02_004111 [Globomyces sp. JEL0801]|nr:hypothetical protein HDV02_004111 [Globomyces sp. JEL0801]